MIHEDREVSAPTSRAKLLAFRAIGIVVAAVLAFAGVEIGLRLLLVSAFTAESDSPLVPSTIPDLGYQMAPHHTRGSYRTDDTGMPVPSGEVATAGYRMLFIGDSIAFGSGMAYEKSLVPGMETRLNKALGEPVAVWNASVPGYNTLQEAILLDALGPRVRPHVVLVAFSMNDYLDPVRLTQGGQLDAIPSGGGGLSVSGLIRRSRTFVFAKEKIKDLQKARPEWFPRWTHDIRYLTRRVGWQRAEAALLRIQETTRKLNAELLLVIFPVEQQLRLNERTAQDDLLEFAKSHGIDALDLFPTFQMEWKQGLYVDWWPEVGSVDKLHLNERGHALAAQQIAERVANGLLRDPKAAPHLWE